MILIVDTIRHAGEHMELNDSIIRSISANNKNLTFLTSKDYFNSFHQDTIADIKLKRVERIEPGLFGLFKTLKTLLKIIIFSKEYSKIIFLSSITYNTFFITVLNRLGLIKPSVYIFLHETSYLSFKGTFSQNIAALFLKLSLIIGLKNHSKYFVIGKYIEESLRKIINFSEDSLEFIEHPVSPLKITSHNLINLKLLKIASLGVQNYEKNSNYIEIIAKKNEKYIKENQLKISTIGKINFHYNPKLLINHMGLKYDKYLIPKYEYEAMLLKQHYILMFLDEKYDLKTSGIIIDAIKFSKPIIALRCNLTEFYFGYFGNIGYLFSNLNEMNKGIGELLHKGFHLDYNHQVENLKAAQKLLNTSNFAKDIQQALN
jgi:hypothetical protein